jgi:hypothetical protein
VEFSDIFVKFSDIFVDNSKPWKGIFHQ